MRKVPCNISNINRRPSRRVRSTLKLYRHGSLYEISSGYFIANLGSAEAEFLKDYSVEKLLILLLDL